MLCFLFLLSFLTTDVSQAASRPTQTKFTLRKACEPLAASFCCPLLQIGISMSDYVLLPTIPGSDATQDSHTSLQYAAIASTLLAPYAGRFATECLFDRTCCKDPVETCCPGVRKGAYLPALSLACKGPVSAAALATNLAILNYCPSLGKIYELLPDLLRLDKEGSLLYIGYEMLTCASCFGHYATDYCRDCITERCCEKAEEKRD